MIKKIAVTLILLSLFFAGSMVAQERYTLDIYVTVYTITTATVDIGYKDINHVTYEPLVQTFYGVGNGDVIHTQIEVWPGQHPAPEWVFSEGWDDVWYAHDYDECDASISDTMYLELWIGVGYIDPTIPPEQ